MSIHVPPLATSNRQNIINRVLLCLFALLAVGGAATHFYFNLRATASTPTPSGQSVGTISARIMDPRNRILVVGVSAAVLAVLVVIAAIVYYHVAQATEQEHVEGRLE